MRLDKWIGDKLSVFWALHFAPPDIKTEHITVRSGTTEIRRRVQTNLHHSDILYTLFILVPLELLFLTATYAALYGIAHIVPIVRYVMSFSWKAYRNGFMLNEVVYAIVVLLIPFLLLRYMRFATKRLVKFAPIDGIMARKFLGQTAFFQDCWVLNPQFLTEFAFFPGSQQTLQTADKGKTGAVTSLVEQVRGFGRIGQRDLQYFKFAIQLQLNFEALQTLARAFFNEFHMSPERGFNAIERQVLIIIEAVSDSLLTSRNMSDFQADLAKVQQQIRNELQRHIDKLGLEIVIFAISQQDDVADRGGYFQNLRQTTQAKLLSDTQIDTAKAEADAGVAQTENARRVSLAEQETAALVAAARVRALEAERPTFDLEAYNANAALRYRIGLLEQHPQGVLLEQLTELSPAEKVQAIEAIAKAARTDYDGAHLVNAQVGSGDSTGFLTADRVYSFVQAYLAALHGKPLGLPAPTGETPLVPTDAAMAA